MIDPIVIVVIIIVLVVAYLLLSGNALDKAFNAAVTSAEASCLAAIKNQTEADFDSAIVALTAAKTAQSASLNQYNTANPAPADVTAISTRLDAIHCGNHASEKAAIDAIATATAANQAANKSGSPDDIQTAISSRDIALRAIKAAGAESSYVTAALSAAITAFKALDYKNEDNDLAFVNSVTDAQSSCNTAISSQNEADFETAIQKIATAKTNKLISTGQYSQTNMPPAVNNAALKLNSVNCSYHTLDKVAVSAVASAVASCATANASKLPSDIQVALGLRAAAQKALSEAMAQYTAADSYITTALSSSISSFNSLTYNNMIVDKAFIDAVDAADSSCAAAIKSAVEADFTANINLIAQAKTKQSASLAQYVGFTAPQAVIDAGVKLAKIPCFTRALDKPVVDNATSVISWFKKAMTSKVPSDLYNAAIYRYYFMIALYNARNAYKAAGLTTTSSIFDAAVKSVTDLDWASYISYCNDTYIGVVDTAYNSCTTAKSSQAEADFSKASNDYNVINNLYYAVYYYYIYGNYPTTGKLPDATTVAYTKQSSLTCQRHNSDNTAIGTIAAAVTACGGTDVAAARKAYGNAVLAVSNVISLYGTSTNWVTTALTGSMANYNSLNCAIATPFTWSGSISASGYFYFYLNGRYVKNVYNNSVTPITFSIPNVVPGDKIMIFQQKINAADPIGFIGSWNDSTGGVVNTSSSFMQNIAGYNNSPITMNDISSFPSDKMDLSTIASKYPAGAKWVSPATDGYTFPQQWYYCGWAAV